MLLLVTRYRLPKSFRISFNLFLRLFTIFLNLRRIKLSFIQFKDIIYELGMTGWHNDMSLIWHCLHTAVLKILHFVNSHKPVLGCVNFLECFELEVFVSDFRSTNTIVSGWLSSLSINLPEAIIAEFIHEAVEQCWRPFFVDSEVAVRWIIILFLNVLSSICWTANSHHP